MPMAAMAPAQAPRSARRCRRRRRALSAPPSSLQSFATRRRGHVLALFGEFHWHLLLTLPRPNLKVDAKAVTEGDTITVYVDTADHPESCNVPQEVHRVAVERDKDYQRADALQKIILDAGYRQVPNLRGEQVLVKKYWIRLRGIDAPENSMHYGRGAKEELVKLVQGKALNISIYDNDRYGRLVGDIDCNGTFVQEHMLKKGLAWHCTAYDQRLELAKWENHAKASRMGLWALPNPEKPWEWRRGKRIGNLG